MDRSACYSALRQLRPRLRPWLAPLLAAYFYITDEELLGQLITWACCRYAVRCRVPEPEPCSAFPEPVPYNTTRLKVVLPSVGQTGTTSVMQAVRQLGLRSYHIEEKMVFLQDAVGDLRDPLQFSYPVARCRIEALSLEPGTDVLPFVLKTSPDARFILTWRDFPSWRRSTTESWRKDRLQIYILTVLGSSFAMAPWAIMWNRLTGSISEMLRKGEPYAGDGEVSILAFLVRRSHGVYYPHGQNVGTRGVFKLQVAEEAYLAHIDEIRRLVPPGRLLEFDVRRYNWGDLAPFLGKPMPPRARKRRPGGRPSRTCGAEAAAPTTSWYTGTSLRQVQRSWSWPCSTR